MVGVVLAIIVGAGLGVYYYSGGDPGKLLGLGVATSTATTSANSVTSVGPNSTVYAKLNTSQGVMEVQLLPSAAPKTVQNFVNLANSGFYDNLVWHRIVKGFAIQTGDPNTRNGGGNPSTWGQGSSNQTVPLEATLNNDQWTLAMARGSDPNSASSQFFINLVNNTSVLNAPGNSYTVFGKITQGTAVAQAIANLPVASSCASSGGLTCPPTNPQQAMLYSVSIQSAP